MTEYVKWDSRLPPPMKSNFRITDGDGRNALQRERGPLQMRKQYTLNAEYVSLGLDCDLIEKEIFSDFYQRVTYVGSVLFLMPNPLLNGALLVNESMQPITNLLGAVITVESWWICMFDGSPPEYVLNEHRWDVFFSVVKMP